MKHPIPDAALDDRLFFGGTAGSGKTYNAMGRVERLLGKRARVVIPDPLGVWWGLRLTADGKAASGYDVVIFGGPHGDLPLTEHAGALIGETVAGMKESCILDLSQLGTKAAERRFMLAFLTALYRSAVGEPLHVVFDEADMWVPQQIRDKEGEAAKLYSMMETIVRRGRIKGFIPWLISQRPAVIAKDVLSQIDGLVAFKLTSVQDRDAIGDWVEGQADRKQWNAIFAQLPTMERGQGLVWIPGRAIIETVQFPVKETFDSSRTPKRGERAQRAAELRPLDLGALKERLGKVEAETKANDPKALRAEIASLKAELTKSRKNIPENIPVDSKAIEAAEERGFERAKKQLTAAAERHVREAHLNILQVLGERLAPAMSLLSGEIRKIKGTKPALSEAVTYSPAAARVPRPAPSVPPRSPSRAKPSTPIADGEITGPQRQLLQALAWWKAMGHERPTRVQVASICGWRITSGHLKNVSGSLRTRGLIDYPSDGTMAMTEEGEALAPAPDMSTTLEESVREILTRPQRQVFDLLPADGSAMTREEITRVCGWEPASGHIKNVLGSMRSLEIIDYPAQGEVARADWLRAERVAA